MTLSLHSNTGFPQVVESPWIFSLIFQAEKVLENRSCHWKSSNFIIEVLESYRNFNQCDSSKKGWKLKCRFWFTSTDAIKIMHMTLMNTQSESILTKLLPNSEADFSLMPGGRINTMASCKHFTYVWSDIRQILLLFHGQASA